MKMRTLFLIGLLGAVASVQADGVYKILEWDIPPVIQPGQQVGGKVKIQVVTPGDPVFYRPLVGLESKVDPKHNMDIPADQVTPWKLAETQKPGDILWSGFILNVPMDFPVGKAMIRFNLMRKGSELVLLEDATGKAQSGTDFRIPVQVAKGKSLEKEVEQPLVVKRMAKPTLDGKVDSEEWKSAGAAGNFVENMGKDLKASTRAYLGYDDKNLYIAFVCDEPLMDKTGRTKFTGRDPGIYNGNETVYVLLNPQADRTSYMQFVVDILNQRFDALGRDPVGYNPPWESKVWEGEKSWSVEMAIPFGSLGVTTPESGSQWYGDFFRIRFVDQREISAWRATGTGFESPGAFGTLIFDSVQKSLMKSVGEIDKVKTEFPAELAGMAGAWRSKIAKLQKTIAGLDEAKAVAELGTLLGQMESLRKEGKVLNRKRLQLSGNGLIAGQTQPYELCVGQPLDSDDVVGPVQVTMLQDEWVDLAWNLTNVTDETITVRCSTLTGDGDFKNVPNLGTGGHEYLLMKLSGMDSSWYQAMPAATGDGRKMWDALSPIPSGVVRVAPGETAQVWLTLHLPKDAQAGEQKFWASIYPIDGTKIEPMFIPVTVKAVPQSITAKRYIDVFTWNVLGSEVTDNEPWHQAHLDDLAAHGVNMCLISNYFMLPRMKANPDGTFAKPFDFTKADRFLKIATKKFDKFYLNLDIWAGATRYEGFIDLDINDPNYAKAFKTWFVAVLEFLKTHGITNDNMVICPFDESTDARCLQIAKWVKEVDPSCKIVIDSSTSIMEDAQKLNAVTDVWMPHHKHFFQEDIAPCLKMIRDSKKTFWMYYYSEGPNEKAQDPTLFYLAKFWWCYDNNLTGFGYWASQYYGNPWYRVIYTGNPYDTSMVYPTQDGVAPSRRWQAWRRGWQDYNLLSMLREKLEKAGDEAGLKRLNESVHDAAECPGDPMKREQVRAWIKANL
jgi:hypothetical protein